MEATFVNVSLKGILFDEKIINSMKQLVKVLSSPAVCLNWSADSSNSSPRGETKQSLNWMKNI